MNERPACLKRRPPLESSVRKPRRSHFPPHHPATHWHRQRARTCFEGPFGELLRATGPMAKANPFRFSTKYQDNETDLLYYGYRYYNPSTGRWISRDPIGEFGGKHVYCFVYNRTLDRIDPKGLKGIGLLGALSDCGTALLSRGVNKWLDQRIACAEIAKRIGHGSVPNPGEPDSYDIDLCKGFSFRPNTYDPQYHPKSLARSLGDCVLGLLKGKMIEEALKEVADETKRRILQEILKQASDYQPSAKITATVAAKCEGSKLYVRSSYVLTVQAGGLTMSEKLRSFGPFGCRALDSLCCSCKHNPWREKR
jgi:RHS repeat-associated protein